MVCPLPDTAPAIRYRHLALGGCLLALLGVKILLIARLGSPTPVWDQWGETSVYLPYLSHTLTFGDLIAFHNEHRLLLARLAWLAMLHLSGSWNPMLQMLVDAVIHVVAIGFLLVALGRVLNVTAFIILLAFALLFFAVPFGWDNTLWGFQIQFYFLILFSIVSLFLLCQARAWSLPWLIGTMLAIAGYFSVASGAMILPAAIALALVQLALGRRSGFGELAGIALHAAISIVVIHDVLFVAPHVASESPTLSQLFASLMITASWPVAGRSWHGVLKIIPAVLLFAPALLLTGRTLAQRPGLSDRRWFYLALAAWLALQIVALSVGRPGGTIESRYSDIFLVGVVLNFAALLLLLSTDATKPRTRLACGAAVWILAVMLGGGQKATANIIDDIAIRHANGLKQTENVKNFIATNDFAYLDNKPPFEVPFPFPEILRDLLRKPELRAILPPELTGAPDTRKVQPVILSSGPLLIPIGLALFLIAAMAVSFGRPRPETGAINS